MSLPARKRRRSRELLGPMVNEVVRAVLPPLTGKVIKKEDAESVATSLEVHFVDTLGEEAIDVDELSTVTKLRIQMAALLLCRMHIISFITSPDTPLPQSVEGRCLQSTQSLNSIRGLDGHLQVIGRALFPYNVWAKLYLHLFLSREPAVRQRFASLLPSLKPAQLDALGAGDSFVAADEILNVEGFQISETVVRALMSSSTVNVIQPKLPRPPPPAAAPSLRPFPPPPSLHMALPSVPSSSTLALKVPLTLESPAFPRTTPSSAPSGSSFPLASCLRWTEEEDNALQAAVVSHGRDWVAVAAAVGTRSSRQCADRWRRFGELLEKEKLGEVTRDKSKRAGGLPTETVATFNDPTYDHLVAEAVQKEIAALGGADADSTHTQTPQEETSVTV